MKNPFPLAANPKPFFCSTFCFSFLSPAPRSAGLFLEGASLDRKTGKLVESRPKVLYEQMPVIYIYAINTTAGKDSKLYECPIYRKPARSVSNFTWAKPWR